MELDMCGLVVYTGNSSKLDDFKGQVFMTTETKQTPEGRGKMERHYLDNIAPRRPNLDRNLDSSIHPFRPVYKTS